MHIWILLVKTVTAIYHMVGGNWSLKIQPMSRFQGLRYPPTVLRDFSVQKVGTERVPKVQIYLHNKMIASKQLGSCGQFVSHFFTVFNLVKELKKLNFLCAERSPPCPPAIQILLSEVQS